MYDDIKEVFNRYGSDEFWNDDKITYEYETHFNVNKTKILKYSLKLYHKILNETKIISAPEKDILVEKVYNQKLKWDEKLEIMRIKKIVERRSQNASQLLDEIGNILNYPFLIKDKTSLNDLKKFNEFDVPSPQKPKNEKLEELPTKPDPNREIFIPTFSLFENLFKSLKTKKIEKYKFKYEYAVKVWEKEKDEIEAENIKIEEKNKKKLKSWEQDFNIWLEKKFEFESSQQSYNQRIDKISESYKNLDPTIFEEYIKIILKKSEYPDFLEKDFELIYSNENQILVVEYLLPDIAIFPRLKEVQFIPSRNEQKEIFLSELQFTKLYDDTLYRIVLRTLKEIFEADFLKFVKVVVFNGWINSVNKATGNMDVKCILSIQVKRKNFLEINLKEVEPKACFKSLKGIASSKLNTLTPIRPIINLNKDDKRFVDGYDVSQEIDSSTNIAAMDWKDFEHFIREIFEREFSSNGGVVKVTQASRDGGVDAIAFDPDPIKGGKIIIQAKRYTNLVDVSAVRDLYGTIVNEGAIKGILVTTSNYGADSYEFAKDKPITLLNGGNLLHLLEKQGQKVRIDLAEAKKILKEK